MGTIAKKAVPKGVPKKVKRASVVEATPKDELDEALVRFSELKEQAAHISDQVKVTQSEILELMAKRKIKQHVVRIGFKRVSGTIVAGTRVVIDEVGLKKRLGADLWNKVTTRSLDRKKLDAYLASGEVDVNEVAAVSEEVENAPYLRITVK